jgi:hypothetical protein
MTLPMKRSRLVASFGAVVAALAIATSVMAYGPQVPTLITVTPSSLTFLCGHPEAVTATVLDQDGLPIKQATVTWSFSASPSSDDRILQATSKTDKNGIAKTMVKLACVAGDRSITASTGGISGSAVVHVDLGHPGQGHNNAAQAGEAATLGAAVTLGAALRSSRAPSMQATSALASAAADSPVGGEPARLAFALVFLGIAALIVGRRLVLSRR